MNSEMYDDYKQRLNEQKAIEEKIKNTRLKINGYILDYKSSLFKEVKNDESNIEMKTIKKLNGTFTG